MALIKPYKLNGKTLYEIRVYAGRDEMTGKKRYVHRRGFSTKKAATLTASRISLNAASGSVQDITNLTFEAVYREWDGGYVNSVRESTYERTTTQVRNHILPIFGHQKISKIRSSQIQRAVNMWSKSVTKNYKRWFVTLKRILTFAVQHGYISKNPADLVIVPKIKESTEEKSPNFWDRDELSTFFSYIDPEKEPEKDALFRILAFGGLRRGECLALTWADISFSDNTININKTLTQGMHGHQIVQPPKTRKSRRIISMDSKTMSVLKHWRLVQMKKYMALGFNTSTPDQLVFSNTKNQHWVLHRPAEWLNTIENKHNIQHRITIHGFRHSHASALFSAGATIKEVQERLGHSDIQTTMNIYTHVTKEQNIEASEKLAAYLNF
ncbi:tyrosine-type recombinase/integrase [Lacticaseibacillus saniviri]